MHKQMRILIAISRNINNKTNSQYTIAVQIPSYFINTLFSFPNDVLSYNNVGVLGCLKASS